MTTMEFHIAGAAPGTPRRAMIDSQLRTSGVNEPWVLAAMAALPREDFVPEAQKAAAYIDRAVPLGNGRYLAAPLVHGKMLAAAEPAKTDKVLLVTSGSTYLAALLGPLVGALTQVDAADVANGIAGAPYGLIIIDGAIEQLPDALVGALADDGRIVSGLVDRGVTRLALGRKAAGAVSFVALSDLGIPVLPEFAAPKGWSF
ncbi:protein-L-isoaspartate O-methyltransferase family protein [Novosphingobium ovatum]|nr:protein-L-isoaspartate O-methyltransferase [Novosphingobium ovatum]